MNSDAFPKLEVYRPAKLTAAVEKLDGADGKILGGFNGAYWSTLLKKIRDQVRLKPSEKLKLIGSIERIPNELQAPFFELFLKDLDSSTLMRCSQVPGKNLSPAAALQILTHDSVIQRLGREHLPEGFFRFRDPCLEGGVKAICDHGIQNRISALDLVSSFGNKTDVETFTPAQLRVFSELINRPDSTYIVESAASVLIVLLRRLIAEPREWDEVLDRLVSSYMKSDSTWESKILDSNYPLGRIVQDLLTQNEDIERIVSRRAALGKLVDRLRWLQNILERLNQVEPDRGKFWGGYLKFANQVIAQLAPADSNVETAVAFYFRKTVVVEFAPTGNAAYVYDSDTFERELRTKMSWKRMDLVRTRWRHIAGWQYTFSGYLKAIIGSDR